MEAFPFLYIGRDELIAVTKRRRRGLRISPSMSYLESAKDRQE